MAKTPRMASRRMKKLAGELMMCGGVGQHPAYPVAHAYATFQNPWAALPVLRGRTKRMRKFEPVPKTEERRVTLELLYAAEFALESRIRMAIPSTPSNDPSQDWPVLTEGKSA